MSPRKGRRGPKAKGGEQAGAPFRQRLDAAEALKELLPGQSVALLQTLHLIDRDGRLQADARRKLKQVNHLVRKLSPALEDLLGRHEAPVIVDAGAGNAYLGFILYEMVLQRYGRGQLLAVEPRPELVAQVRERAREFGFDRLEIFEAELHEAPLPERLHMVVALHACDVATDQALALAIQRGVDYVAVVPCCEAEVASQLKALKGQGGGVERLWRHAWHRREFGAHLTNVIRTLALEAHGYQVTVTELTGWEHSIKNELILAKRVNRFNKEARVALDALLAEIPVRPWLIRALDDAAGAGTETEAEADIGTEADAAN